ncbi:unnamed protein product [Cuscuta epithymum]|uniref:Uncharacterized protein n=1 Tax=Cuscuta epithymum TaxID=186058 RepID=A0AAV0DNL9_9ASTE|nr:unnamed protein product [Cuscuta epithymum]
MYQASKSSRLKSNWIRVAFSAVKEYSEEDILQVREEWITYAASLLGAMG